MNTARAISHAITLVTLVASIVVSRDWLLSGGGDFPSFAVWTVLCVAVGFSISMEIADRAFEAKLSKELDKRKEAGYFDPDVLSDSDIDNLFKDA